MKLNKYSALLGALLISGSVHAVANKDQVKEVLKTILPDGPSADDVINHCFGGCTNAFWAQTYINEKLAADSRTSKCTARHTSWLLPSIPTLTNSYEDDSCTKLVIIRENDEIVCGIKITVKEGKVSKSEYIDAGLTKTTKDKRSVSSTWSQWGNPASLFWWPAHYTGTVLKYAGILAVATGALYYHKSTVNALEAQIAKLTPAGK